MRNRKWRFVMGTLILLALLIVGPFEGPLVTCRLHLHIGRAVEVVWTQMCAAWGERWDYAFVYCWDAPKPRLTQPVGL